MNKLIQKLAIETFFDEATDAPSDKMYTFSEEKLEKFAQLIIKECRSVAFKGAYRTSGAITKHFGVEE